MIEKLSIRDARVTMTGAGLKGQGITFTLPDIQLANLGKRPNGITAGQAANIVTNALISRIAQRVLTNIDLLRKGGNEGALDALKGLFRLEAQDDAEHPGYPCRLRPWCRWTRRARTSCPRCRGAPTRGARRCSA